MKFVKNIPMGIKILLSINLIVFFGFMILETCFNLNLTTYFSANIISSGYFNPIQIITYMFVHSNSDFLHIISNLILLMIFGISLEHRIGCKHIIILYVISGICSFMFFNIIKEIEKTEFRQICSEHNIELSKLSQNKAGKYDYNDYYISLNSKQLNILNQYRQINAIFLGASGSVAGIMVMFVLIYLFNFKYIFQLLIGLFFITISLLALKTYNTETSGVTYGHLGGLIMGMLYFIVYRLYGIYYEIKKRG
jgi:membrane associated rhomboid family serine protease